MPPNASADRIVLANSIITMDPRAPRAEAIAITGERIRAVGNRDEVMALSGPDTEIVELGDVCVLPGLVEPHTHPDLCAQCYEWIDVSGFRHPKVEQVEQALRQAVSEAEPGEWLYAFGLDPMLTEGLGTWGRQRLDAISPDNPTAVMIQSMHTLFFNTAAMQAAGIDEHAADPPGGGRYLRNEDGSLDGSATETPALVPLLRFFDSGNDATRERIWDQYWRYAAAGITTIGMPGLFVNVDMLSEFETLSERPDLPIRNVGYLRHFQTQASGRKPGEGNDRFRIQGVKLWYDGSPYSGTMLLDEPYLESRLCCCTLGIPSGTTGHANFDPNELHEVVGQLQREGWQILTHAQGDRGIREILDLYEAVLEANPRDDHRWRLEHCALIAREDLARAASLGVALSFHVNHVHYYGPELRDSILGSERAERLMPIRSAIDAGHRVSLHADSPMYPPEPFKLMRTAVTRRARTGEVIGAHEAITVEEALRAVTLDAAWQLFAEDRVGSLEAGKLADLTVVDRDPLQIAPEELDQTQVLATWMSGRPTRRH